MLKKLNSKLRILMFFDERRMCKLVFKYDKLKGRIREKLGTSEKLAQELGITSGALSAKLNNKSYFSNNSLYAFLITVLTF